VWNVVTEVIGTFVLVYVILQFGNTPSEIGPLAVALLVVGIGASLGGPTGYAINPARDLGPASRTPCCPSGAREAATGDTPGYRSSARSSAACSPVSPPRSSAPDAAERTPP
jgi:glycerol uptake facilitator-like aquaporin